MRVKAKVVAMTVLLAAVCCKSGFGQATPTTILEIDVENYVQYFHDITDLSKFATDPNAVPAGFLTNSPFARNFGEVIGIGDIVAVNGQPAKGTLTRDGRPLDLKPAPNPGQAIADTSRGIFFADTFEILKGDGSPIGIIMSYGTGPASPPPGAPLAVRLSSFAIVGGTGAFLGARGQWGHPQQPFSQILGRAASIAEDPVNRRRNGGTRFRAVMQLIPLSRPEITQTLAGPAVAHSSDFVLVTASRPAAPGEILSLFATGLGPTLPGVDPGTPFPTTPPAVVNSPVGVTVNGRAAEVTAAVGFPGAVDGYQVNFRVPPDAARGTATIQVSVAWIAGPEVRIAIQ